MPTGIRNLYRALFQHGSAVWPFILWEKARLPWTLIFATVSGTVWKGFYTWNGFIGFSLRTACIIDYSSFKMQRTCCAYLGYFLNDMLGKHASPILNMTASICRQILHRASSTRQFIRVHFALKVAELQSRAQLDIGSSCYKSLHT